MAENAETPQVEEGLFLFVEAGDPIEWPVDVQQPVSGGHFRTFRCYMQLTSLETMELSDVAQRSQQTTDADCGTEKDPLWPIVHGWRELYAGTGKPLPYNQANKGKVLRSARVRNGIFNALGEMVVGQRLGNSAPARAPGPNRQARRAQNSQKTSGGRSKTS